MIEGLRLTITGEELRRLLDERADTHRRRAAHWNAERVRPDEDQTEERPLLPEHMCEYEADRHEWRAEVLEFIRDHVEALEVYRLGESDLEFGELLPEKPGQLEQQEYEQRTGVGFALERISKNMARWPYPGSMDLSAGPVS